MPSPNLEVAHLFLSLPVGGAEDLVLSLLPRSEPGGFHIRLACLRELGPAGVVHRDQGGDIDLLSVAPSKRLNPVGIWRLSRWLRRERIDLVHTHVYNAHVYGVLAARLAGIPAVMHHHKTFTGLKPHRLWMLRQLSRWCPRQITLSTQTREDICRAYGIAPDTVEAFSNPVDETVFHPVADRGVLRRELGLDERAFLVGTVASLTPPKNHALNQEMMRRAVQAGFPGRFLLFGEGPLRESLEQARDASSIGEAFTLMGARRPIAPWMQSLDLFVLASSWEGQPLALLQAQACGLPILASRIEGNIHALGEDHPGLFDLANPDDYANKVRRAQTEPGYRKALLDYQREQSPPRPDLSDYVLRLGRLYRDCLKA